MEFQNPVARIGHPSFWPLFHYWSEIGFCCHVLPLGTLGRRGRGQAHPTFLRVLPQPARSSTQTPNPQSGPSGRQTGGGKRRSTSPFVIRSKIIPRPDVIWSLRGKMHLVQCSWHIYFILLSPSMITSICPLDGGWQAKQFVTDPATGVLANRVNAMFLGDQIIWEHEVLWIFLLKVIGWRGLPRVFLFCSVAALYVQRRGPLGDR